jgi:hypothetical protein
LLPLNKPSLRRVRRVSGLLFIKEVPATRSMHTNKKFHFAIGGFESKSRRKQKQQLNDKQTVRLSCGITYSITLNKTTSNNYKISRYKNQLAPQKHAVQLFVFNTTHYIPFHILY